MNALKQYTKVMEKITRNILFKIILSLKVHISYHVVDPTQPGAALRKLVDIDKVIHDLLKYFYNNVAPEWLRLIKIKFDI